MATTFSVIVTNYNYKAYIREAVESALGQSRRPSQIIVVDDGSTDGSPELLRELYGAEPRVKLVFTANGGQLAAFRAGMAHADADVVCFLDADDYWGEDYLARIGALYDARRDVDFVFSDLAHFGASSDVEAFAPTSCDLGLTPLITYAIVPWFGAPTSALSLRTRLARQTIDLPPHMVPTWRICADDCLVFGAGILGGRKYYLPTGAVHYRTHGENNWHSVSSPEARYRHDLNVRCLVNHYAGTIGLHANCMPLLKQEFLAKPAPSEREIEAYAQALSGKHRFKLLRKLYRARFIRRAKRLALKK